MRRGTALDAAEAVFDRYVAAMDLMTDYLDMKDVSDRMIERMIDYSDQFMWLMCNDEYYSINTIVKFCVALAGLPN